MSKKPEIQIQSVLQDISFKPQDAHHKIKARFWQAQDSNPMFDLDRITGEDVARVTREPKVKTWWSTIPGFKDWFLNRQSYLEEAQAIFAEGFPALRALLASRDPKSATAQINAMKFLATLLGYDRQEKVRDLTKELPDDVEELKAVVLAGYKKLKPASE